MTTLLLAFDVLLALVLIVLAGGILLARDIFVSAVLFVVFSLAIALGYVRLGAVDVALAEAAVGGGLLGALALGVAQALRRGASGERRGEARE